MPVQGEPMSYAAALESRQAGGPSSGHPKGDNAGRTPGASYWIPRRVTWE